MSKGYIFYPEELYPHDKMCMCHKNSKMRNSGVNVSNRIPGKVSEGPALSFEVPARLV